jgi:hypothetical protein
MGTKLAPIYLLRRRSEAERASMGCVMRYVLKNSMRYVLGYVLENSHFVVTSTLSLPPWFLIIKEFSPHSPQASNRGKRWNRQHH